LKLDVRVFLTLTLWLFLLEDDNLNVNSFLDHYFILMANPPTDSANLYDFPIQTLIIPLPTVESRKDGISELTRRYPSLIQNEKIKLWSDKTQERVRYFLEEFLRTATRLEPPSLVIGDWSELSTEYFHKFPNEHLFLHQTDFNEWINQQQYLKIHLIPSEPSDMPSTPYLFLDPNQGRYFIIQHTSSFDSAIQVALAWYNCSINLGPLAQEYSGLEDEITTEKMNKLCKPNQPYPRRESVRGRTLAVYPDHIIYGVSETSELYLLDDRSRNSDNILEIINIQGHYGALLPL